MPFVRWHRLRKDTVAIRQDVFIFWKQLTFLAEMQGCHALKQFMRKEVYHFQEFHTTRVLVGLLCAVKF